MLPSLELALYRGAGPFLVRYLQERRAADRSSATAHLQLLSYLALLDFSLHFGLHLRPGRRCVITLTRLFPIAGAPAADGKDLWHEPIERRKALLAQLVRKPLAGIVVNATFEEPGDVVFKHACALGCEGIVSKRLGSRYRAGRTRDWLKFKNPAAPAVKREAEEDWGKQKWR